MFRPVKRTVHQRLPAATKESFFGGGSSMPFFQAKLTVNQPGDRYELEADRVADQVMRRRDGTAPAVGRMAFTPVSNVQKTCAACAHQREEEGVRRKETGDGASGQSAPSIVSAVLASGGGQPLDATTQDFMESRMGQDFSQVRVHTGARAAESAGAIQARAYTSGREVVFGSGEYQPGTAEGQRLLAHELVHVGQQAGGYSQVQRDTGPGELMDPFATEVEPAAAIEAEAVALRDRILAPIRRGAKSGLLTQLQNLTSAESRSLLADSEFWREIRTTFRGSPLWIIFTTVFFNSRVREPHPRLIRAISTRNIREAMDAVAIIIARGEVGDDRYWDTLTEVIFAEFKGNPLSKELYRIILLRRSAQVAAQMLSVRTAGVHYEENAGGGHVLKTYASSRSMIVYTTQEEMRVVVRINFVDGLDPAQPYYFTDEKAKGAPERWRSGIERIWNNRFVLHNGTRTLRFTVAPFFIFQAGHADKTIKIMSDSKTQRCPGSTDVGRANAECWFADENPTAIAHEFGHLLGAKDEYNLPGSAAEIPAATRAKLSPADLPRTTMEGITGRARPAKAGGHDVHSLMGDHTKSTSVHARNIRALIAAFNAGLPPGTPPYTIRER